MAKQNNKLDLHIKFNGKLAKQMFFDRFTNQDNKFIDITLRKEDLKREFHKVDFIIKNPISPLSLLESVDGRELGILFESVTIK